MTTRCVIVTPRRLAAVLVLGVLVAGAGPRPAQAQDPSRTSGWDIDKEDRDVGWIRTDSRRLDGDNFGVYAKGVEHRYKDERILFVDEEEDIKTDDRSVEKRILDEIGRSL
jgi:hypothetical protein